MQKHIERAVRSARGELFNPLIWPFLLASLAFGLGFITLEFTSALGNPNLHQAMSDINEYAPLTWAIVLMLTLVGGLTFLMFNIPPVGKFSGILGFAAWAFAMMCYFTGEEIILAFALGLPNAWFWFWQYLSLSKFRKEESIDRQTMIDYDGGQYDDVANPIDSKVAREDNRGQRLQ